MRKKINELNCFDDYCKGVTITEIARKTGVCYSTIKRLSETNQWEVRRRTIQEHVQRVTDKEKEERAVRHIKIAKFLQGKGVEGIRGVVLDQTNALKAIQIGIDTERKVSGDADNKSEQQTIEIELGDDLKKVLRINVNKPSGSDEFIEDDAPAEGQEVVSGQAETKQLMAPDSSVNQTDIRGKGRPKSIRADEIIEPTVGDDDLIEVGDFSFEDQPQKDSPDHQ